MTVGVYRGTQEKWLDWKVRKGKKLKKVDMKDFKDKVPLI